MSEPFLAEIRIVSFTYAPRGWAFCNGQILPINQNQALFSLLGTTYGGDGRVNFALPDLRDRTPIHVGQGHVLGQRGGEVAHTLTLAELPTHLHALRASNTTGDAPVPFSSGQGNVLASNPSALYNPPNHPPAALHAASVTSAGGGQAHQNMQPYLGLNFCIALAGIFPSRN